MFSVSSVVNIKNIHIMKQTTMAILAGICLLLSGCTADGIPGSEINGDVRLRPGEQAVMFSLDGISSGEGVPVSRTEADAGETIAGENEIQTLRIYSFVNTSGSESDASSLTLERIYSYEQGGAANDFTLSPQAGGYRFGIGVPEDAYERRFLMLANTSALAGVTAVAATEGDRSAATPLSGVLTQQTTTAGTSAALAAPFPMSSNVPKPVLMNDGTYRYDDGATFTTADLARGLKVKLRRRVARIDISNPFVSQFVLSGLSYTRQDKADLFDGAAGGTSTTVAIELPLTDAEWLPAAVYSFPGAFTLTLKGTYLGAETTVSIPAAVLEANSRYVVRVKSAENNVAATLEVLPWDEGADIDAEVTATTYNTAVASVTGQLTTSGGYSASCFGLIELQKRIVRVAQNSYTCVAASGGLETARALPDADLAAEEWVVKEFVSAGSGGTYQIKSYPFVRFTGASGNSAPIGVILSAPLQGRVKVVHSQKTDDNTAEVRLYLIPTEEEMTDVIETGSGFLNTVFMRQRTVPSAPATVTLVVQDGVTGALRYEDWRVVEDCFDYELAGMGKICTSIPGEWPADVRLRNTSSWLSRPWTLDEATPILLSPYVGEVSLCLDPEKAQSGGVLTRAAIEVDLSSRTDGSAYIEAQGEPWAAVCMEDVLDISGQSQSVLAGRARIPSQRILTTVQDNMTGAERRATLVVRRNTYSGSSDSGGGGGVLNSRAATVADPTVLDGTQLEERRYTLVQPPVSAAVYAQMASSAGLRLGNGYPVDELYMDGNTIYVGKKNTKRAILNPCCVVSEGRKPVRIIIPVGCNWLYESLVYGSQSSQGILTRGRIERDDPPSGFVRQLRLLPNEMNGDRSVSFSVQTYEGGAIRTSTYTLVQRPTYQADSSGGESALSR